MQFFYCKDEALVKPVKTSRHTFCILQPSEKVKIVKSHTENQYLIYDNQEVIILIFQIVHPPPFSKTSWQNDYITYGINMTFLWWMGIVKSKNQFSSSWWFLNMVTPWFVWDVDNTNIWV